MPWCYWGLIAAVAVIVAVLVGKGIKALIRRSAFPGQ